MLSLNPGCCALFLWHCFLTTSTPHHTRAGTSSQGSSPGPISSDEMTAMKSTPRPLGCLRGLLTKGGLKEKKTCYCPGITRGEKREKKREKKRNSAILLCLLLFIPRGGAHLRPSLHRHVPQAGESPSQPGDGRGGDGEGEEGMEMATNAHPTPGLYPSHCLKSPWCAPGGLTEQGQHPSPTAPALSVLTQRKGRALGWIFHSTDRENAQLGFTVSHRNCRTAIHRGNQKE